MPDGLGDPTVESEPVWWDAEKGECLLPYDALRLSDNLAKPLRRFGNRPMRPSPIPRTGIATRWTACCRCRVFRHPFCLRKVGVEWALSSGGSESAKRTKL